MSKKKKKEDGEPVLLLSDFLKMSAEQQAVEESREYYRRHPATHFPETEDPNWILNAIPSIMRPQTHALGSRIFVSEEDKQRQQAIDEKFKQQYGTTDLQTADLFPISRKNFKKMKAELEEAENNSESVYTISVLPPLYLDEEWLTKGELFEPTSWDKLKLKLGIETPIETIDVLAKEKKELDEWRKKKGFFDLPPNYRQILKLEPEDVWSKEQEEQAIQMIKESCPSITEAELNQVREEARRRASVVAQVWGPIIYGPISTQEEAAIDYNLRDLSWIPQTPGLTDEKRKEIDWYMDTEIRKILQGIGHFSEQELGPVPEPPDSIKHRFHLTPEQYLYYKSYWEDDPVTEYTGLFMPPEYFPKLKTEAEERSDPWALKDIDLKLYHDPEYKKELTERLSEYAEESIERQNLIASFRLYGMTLRKDENEVYLKRMQQDPFYDEDARDRVMTDIRFKKAPWRDEMEDYDEDLVDVPGVMLPPDPLRDPNRPLDEANAPFDTDLIPLDVQRKMQSGDYIDNADMLWPVNNYYYETPFSAKELELTDTSTFHQLMLDELPKLTDMLPRHHPDELPQYNPNSTERMLLERAEKLFHHFTLLKRGAHINHIREEGAEEPTWEQKIGSEPMPTLKRKHPVYDYVDLMTSAADKIWYDLHLNEPQQYDYLPILDLTINSTARSKLKLKDETLREYTKNDPIIQAKPPPAPLSNFDRPANEAYTRPSLNVTDKDKKQRLEELEKKVDKELQTQYTDLDDLIYDFQVHKDYRDPPPVKPEFFSVPQPELTLEEVGLVPYKEQIEQTIKSLESYHGIPRILNYIQLLSTKLGMDQWNLEQLYAAAELGTVVLLTPLRMMRIQSFVSPSAKARFRSVLRWIPFSPSVTSVFILKKLIKWGLRALGLQTVIYFPIACFAMNLMDNLCTNVIIRNTDPITAAVEMYKDYGWRTLIRGLPWKILSSTADVVMDSFTGPHGIFRWLDNRNYRLVSRLWPWSTAVLERVQGFAYGIAKRLVLSPFAYLRFRSYVSDPHRQTRRRAWPSVLSVIGLVPVCLIEYTIRYFIKSTVVPYIALANPAKVIDYSQKWAPGTGPVRIHTLLYPSWESQLYSDKYWAL